MTDSDLERFYEVEDPWGYEVHPDDQTRKSVLLDHLRRLDPPEKVIDIGCGHGFVTRDLPGGSVLGVDVSVNAIRQATRSNFDARCSYEAADLLDLPPEVTRVGPFNLVVITGVLYPQYVGKALTTVYRIVDRLLAPSGYLASVHIGPWYRARFPYVLCESTQYPYREMHHVLEIYRKR